MLGTIAAKINNYRKYNETYRELARLSNRELSDLGIERHQIVEVARKAAL